MDKKENIFQDKYKVKPDEAEIVDNYFEDTLYTHPFGNEKGKYFTIVDSDNDIPQKIDIDHPYPVRNKIKTTLTFINDHGDVTGISFQRFKYYKKKQWVVQDEKITFSYDFFKKIIGFLQSLPKLKLDEISERRIPLVAGSDLNADNIKQLNTLFLRTDVQKLVWEFVKNENITTTDIVNIGYRKRQLGIFNKLLNEPTYIEEYKKNNNIKESGIEAVWQNFFEINDWIFGYGLTYLFNKPLEGKKLEQVVVGADIAQSGKRADGVLKTSGIINSLCLVELKTHSAPLLKNVANPYRSDCWQISDDLNGGIVQAQKTVQKTIQNISLSPELKIFDDSGNPTGEIVFSYRPKSYLIIGSLSEFKTELGINQEKYSSFELLRKNMISPEIITFDELYERAKFIVSHSQEK